MKRIAALLFPLVALVSPLAGQQFSAGVLGGVAITDVSGANLSGSGSQYHKFGIVVGGLVNTRVTKNSFLQMEIRYIQKGSQMPPDTAGITNVSANPFAPNANANFGDYYLLRLNYIDVALAYKHNLNIILNKNHTSRFAIEGGVSLGELVGYYYTVESIETPTDLNTLDISLFAGIDYNFSPHVYICTRYNNSITPAIARDANNSLLYPYYSSWNRGNNLAFTITFGVIFGNSGQPGNPPPSNKAPSDNDQ